jgi:CheY-like chemotaxis protein
VLAAGDGHEALEVLRDEEGVDLVLMDLMLPGLDGDDTIRHIRAETRFRDLPIVALTARTDPEARARTLAAGASEFLGKPVDPVRLRDTLGRYLSADTAQAIPAVTIA